MAASRKPAKAAATPARTFLDLIRKQIKGIRRDVPHLIDMGQAMGDSLLAGGTMFIPHVAGFWRSEMGGRAGGVMNLFGKPSRAKDVGFFTVPDPRRWDPDADKEFARLLRGKARLFAVCRPEDLGVGAKRVEACTGGTDPEIGLYKFNDWAPLATTRQFEQFVRGWITIGETVAACTRGEKMPVLYMSVWLEGAMARNASFSFTEYNNYGEPRDCRPTCPTPVFHRDRYVPPMDPGYPAGEFLATAEMFVDTLDRQATTLAKAGRWMAQAAKARKRVWVVAVGHSYPRLFEFPEENNDYPLNWGWSASDILKGMPDELGEGDVALYLGYAPVIPERVNKILKRGIKFIHTSPYGSRKGVGDHPNLLWFDLPWRPGDAEVYIRGYGARMMPASSTAHSIAYNAILAEMADRMGWVEGAGPHVLPPETRLAPPDPWLRRRRRHPYPRGR